MQQNHVKKVQFKEMEQFVLNKLRKELPKNLYYHRYEHTLDVLQAAERLAEAENVSDADRMLLRTAILYHDSGYIADYKHHEEQGCKLVKATLPDFGYDNDQIEAICGMIMASKVPQSPKNRLEEIICDADLDYLGRDDFWIVGQLLYREFFEQQVVSDGQNWNRLQIKFLESHTYFTTSAKKSRNETKQQHIEKIKQIVSSYK